MWQPNRVTNDTRNKERKTNYRNWTCRKGQACYDIILDVCRKSPKGRVVFSGRALHVYSNVLLPAARAKWGESVDERFYTAGVGFVGKVLDSIFVDLPKKGFRGYRELMAAPDGKTLTDDCMWHVWPTSVNPPDRVYVAEGRTPPASHVAPTRTEAPRSSPVRASAVEARNVILTTEEMQVFLAVLQGVHANPKYNGQTHDALAALSVDAAVAAYNEWRARK